MEDPFIRKGLKESGTLLPWGCGWEWPAKGTRREINGLAVDSSSVVKVLIRSLAAGGVGCDWEIPTVLSKTCTSLAHGSMINTSLLST